jgi:hypothetical protein
MAKSITAPALIDEEAPENRPSMLLSPFVILGLRHGIRSDSRQAFSFAMAIQRGDGWKSMISLKPCKESS